MILSCSWGWLLVLQHEPKHTLHLSEQLLQSRDLYEPACPLACAPLALRLTLGLVVVALLEVIFVCLTVFRIWVSTKRQGIKVQSYK